MKNVNLFLLVCCTLVLSASQSSAVNFKRIWDTNCNGDFTSYEVPGDVSAGIPTIIRCNCAPESESTGCPDKPSGGIILDPTDQVAADYLIGLSNTAIENGQSNGSQSVNYQVSGEAFVRVYLVTWILNANNQYEQTFTRNDIQTTIEP